MITRICVLVTVFSCSLIIMHMLTVLPKTTALKKISNLDKFMIEDQRTHTRQNYVVQRALEDEIAGESDDVVVSSYDPQTSAEELPALIVDYANMIRNDIILLDNSVETRTRRQGNKIVKNDQSIPDIPCSCEYNVKQTERLNNSYPSYIEYKVCDDAKCTAPYSCKRIWYYLTVLKRKNEFPNEDSQVDIPVDLKRGWIAVKKPVVVGCVCARDHTKLNNT